MNRENPGARTARLLTQRLDDLAGTLERSGASTTAVARMLELASVATVNAVQLDLLSRDRAERIWAGAARRHPVLAGRDAHPLEPYRQDDLAA